ncbi:MAG: transposase [Armatimonadota bacterium]|nr:transposase [Armatimonadota bacterium]
MPEHIHAIVTLPRDLDASQTLNRLKGAWGNRILDVASHADLLRLDSEKQNTKERSVWMRSFVGKTIDREFFFLQKAAYIHNNPVRRGLCENAIDYVWSTARQWDAGFRSDDGVIIGEADIAKLWPRAVRDPLAEVVRRVMRRMSDK